MVKRSWWLTFWVSNLFLVVTLAYGAMIFDSYRYEKSGIQYVAFPIICMPASVVAGVALWLAAGQVGLSRFLSLTSLMALVIFALPDMLLGYSDENLRFGFWLALALAVTHVVATAHQFCWHRCGTGG
jgi:hypothetical protein